MSMIKKVKKGFTLIELVVVIAVIAVLSAVAVVSYISITNRAKESNDHMVIDQINTSLLGSSILQKKATVHDIVETFLEEEGYDVRTIKPELKDTRFVYAYEKGKFGYWKDSKVVYPSDLAEIDFASSNDLWFFEESVAADTSYVDNYSHYIVSADANTSISTNGGIDVGKCTTISSISLTRTTKAAKDLVVRTNSVLTDVNINAPYDTVNHYGEVGKVDIAKIDMNCYNEYGNSKYIKLTEGKVVAKANGNINIVFADNNDGSKVAVIKETNGNISSGYTRVEEVDTANKARENGIELTYAIHIDETTVISGDDFVDYVESSAEFAVETAKQAEQSAKQEKQNGPIGTFNPISFNPSYSQPQTGGTADVTIPVYDEDHLSCYAFDEDTVYYGDYEDEEYIGSGSEDQFASIIYNYMEEHEVYEITNISVNSNVVELVDCDAGYALLGRSNGNATLTLTFSDNSTLNLKVCVGEGGAEVQPLVRNETTGTDYNDIEQAVSEAQTGDRIIVLRDEANPIMMGAKNNKSIIFDLNGHTLSNLSINSLTVSIIDSSDDQTGKVESLFFVCEYGLENPSFVFDPFRGDDAERNDYHEGEGYHYIEMWTDRPAQLTLLGGSYKKVTASSNGIIEVAGAYIYNTGIYNPDSSTPDFAIGAGKAYQYTKLVVKSGIVVGTIVSNRFGSIEISGGYFSQEIEAKYLASGYTCNRIADGIYQVVSK